MKMLEINWKNKNLRSYLRQYLEGPTMLPIITMDTEDEPSFPAETSRMSTGIISTTILFPHCSVLPPLVAALSHLCSNHHRASRKQTSYLDSPVSWFLPAASLGCKSAVHVHDHQLTAKWILSQCLAVAGWQHCGFFSINFPPQPKNLSIFFQWHVTKFNP